MITIANFSSVFEISFALNALLYLFEILPLQRKKHELQLKVYRKAREEKHKEGYSGLPLVWLEDGMRQLQSYSIRFLIVLSLLNSSLSLGFLIASSFFPGFELRWYFMVFLLIWLFIPTSVGYVVSIRYQLPDEIDILQKLIDEAK